MSFSIMFNSSFFLELIVSTLYAVYVHLMCILIHHILKILLCKVTIVVRQVNIRL